MGSSLDLFPTIAKLASLEVPADRKYDGYDLTPVLKGGASSPRREMYFYHGTRLFAVRKDAYKLYFFENNPAGYPERMKKLDTLQLFDLHHDPSEKYDIADEHPDEIREIQAMVQQHRLTLDSVSSQLESRIGVH